MDFGTRLFWAIVAILLGTSAFFARGAAIERAAVRVSEGSLKTGDLVRVTQVVDGDSVVVADPTGATVTVRILGIKAFPPKPERDPAARFGRDAVAAIERAVRDEPVRVLLHGPEKDRHGRTLAELFVGDEDLGLMLVKQGLALTYTVYPLPSTPLYLSAQEDAQAAERGLWGDKEVATRAEVLSREWGRGAE
ncbi:MAG: thermonuclease family protein [Myxococcales bacterium]|nr:thermonuclease family protein [Myxococcales bacterium]